MAVSLQVNVPNLVRNMRFSFTNSVNVISELMQNARRAGASFVKISYDGGSLTVIDNGKGIDNFQSLFTLSESGWDPETIKKDNAFGQGFFSALFAGEHVTVESKGRKIDFKTADALNFASIPDIASDFIGGTRIILRGMSIDHTAVCSAVKRFAKGFPIDVIYNGKEVARPAALAALPTIKTEIGHISICGMNTSNTMCPQIEVFLQGLPIYRSMEFQCSPNIVHLDSEMFAARMPDRDVLIDQAAAIQKISSALRAEQEKFLLGRLREMGDVAFSEKYWDQLRYIGLGKMLLNIPYLPAAALQYADYPSQRDVNVHYDHLPSGITRESVKSGENILYCGYLEETNVPAHMLAYKAKWLSVSGLPADHWAFEYMIDLVDVADQVVVTLTGDDGRNESFSGLWTDGNVRFCDSITLSLDHHQVTFDDEALYLTMQEFVVPGGSNGQGVVEQASSYTDGDEVFAESDRDDDESTLQALITLHRTNDMNVVVKKLLNDGGLFRYQALFGNSFSVSIDKYGQLEVQQIVQQ